ncbi:MAG: alpha/beta fold hydrolase [Kiritimatiellae bacterium]|nr:alpha/beta fold hydrolase [Kiritimatiellia bacterium]
MNMNAVFSSIRIVFNAIFPRCSRIRGRSMMGTLFLAMHCVVLPPVWAQTDSEKVSNAVHAVWLEMKASLSNSVPSLSICLQTSNETFFASSSETPELALTTNMTFRFASNTKNFTATAVLDMQQRGWLNVTDPITNGMPEFSEPYIPTGTNWAIPNKDLITIEQLLRHSAGVYDVDNDTVPGCGGDSYTDYITALDPTHQFTVEEMVAQNAVYQLSYFSPDKGYHYSNTGYAMLAEIVGRVYSLHCGTNKTLTDYLYDHVIGGDAPQAFPEIRFPNLATDTALPEPFMWGTERRPTNITLIVSNCNMSAQVGEGNGYGTLPAMNRFIRANMKGEGVLSNESVHLMQTCTSPDNADYGFGCVFTRDIGFGHNGCRVGNLSFMAYNPDTDVSVAVYLPLVDYSDLMTSFMICFYGMYNAASRSLEALGYPTTPTLANGTTTNLTLSAHETNVFYFTATKEVYYGVFISNAIADIRLELSPAVDPAAGQAFTNSLGWTCSSPGTYRLCISSETDTPASIRLYNYTNTIARVTALVTNLMAENDLVGCGFSFVDGPHTVLETGFGYADRENQIVATKDTVFMIGSCSKTFGAIASMQLVEQGLLDLDAPLTNALPSFSIHQRFADNVITPRTILTHHSGVPGDVFNGGFTVRPHVDAPEQVEMLLAAEYTLMPTNTYWSYNNSGLVMMDLAIEHLSGMNAAEYVSSNLFLRMGMTNSTLRRSADYDFQKIARPYMDGLKKPDEFCNLDIAGSILTTSSDMARYMKMLLAGGLGENGRIISNATLQTMWVKQNADISLDQFFTMMNMGIGFVLDPPWLSYLGKVCWHDGGTLYFRTLMRVASEAQLGCFISWNTAEAVAFNGQIVDSTLKWAYEEKTGIPPPDSCDPGTPAAAVAPPEIIALATGGVFVTGSGYDVFETNAVGLVGHLDKQNDDVNDRVLVYRDNGWFTPTNDYSTQLLFTQTVGRTLCVMKYFSDGVANTMIRGERAADINGFDSAWSNRLGTWWATDMYPDDISWLFPGELTVPIMELFTKDNLLLLLAEEVYVMVATNDSLAFAAGLGRNKGSALQANGDTLAFMGVHYRSQEGIPVLTPGTSTNGVTAGDEVYWFQIPSATNQSLTIDLASSCDLTTYLYDTNFAYIGQANSAHAFQHDPDQPAPLMAGVVRNGTNVGPWSLTLHTNTIPFYQQLAAQDWPDDLIEKAALYGDLDFGHVFVHENRTNQTGNLLKIAVACMKSPNPDAQPFFFCNGGPGDSGIRCAYQYFLKSLTNDYDVYLIDQRGIGYSQPDVNFGEQEAPAAMQYRLIMLQDADLSAINTSESTYDLDNLAAVFALTNVNLHGVSYGTLLAQTLMRREPAWLRAVILDGVVAANIPFLSQRGPIRNDALNALFADIAAHPSASVWYPSFSTTLYTLATNLQNHPVTLQYSGITNEMNGLDYLNAVLNQMTLSDIGSRERIPNITWRASAGETAALSELHTDIHADTNVFISGVQSAGMQMMIFKHDILPFDSMEAASNACADLPPLLRQLNLNFMQDVVDAAALFDPLGQADSSFTNPVTVNMPTLVINGTYDTQTGTNWAAEVASHLPNGWLVIVPTVGHGVLFGGDCPLQTVRNFLANPNQNPVPSCLTNMTLDYPSPWSTNAAALPVEASLTGTVSRAGIAQWYEIQPDLPGAPVGGISNVVYEATLSGAPTNFRMCVCDSTDASLLAERQGNGALDVPSGAAPLYLSIFPDVDGVQTGQYEIAFSIPLLVRAINMPDGCPALIWQGPADHSVDVESAEDLTDSDAFVSVVTNLPALDLLNSYTNPPALDAYRFYRIQETSK